jgi:hypothetical protein
LIHELRKAIETSGKSLNQLGLAARVSAGQLSRFMRGERQLGLEAAGRVCEALGLHLTDCKDKKGSSGKAKG